MDVPPAAFVVVAVLSAIAFILAVVDKARAGRCGQRVPERMLLGVALVGGSPGLVLAMLVARHKTRKPSFLAATVVIVLLHVALAWWWLSA